MQIAAVFGMIALIAIWLLSRRKGVISPIDFFVGFMLTQFGPHILLNQGNFELSSLTSSDVSLSYFAGVSLGYVFLASGIGVGLLLIPKKSIPMSGNAFIASHRSEYQTAFRHVCAVTAVYIIIFLAADGPGLPRLTENLRFFLGTSDYNYTEIRRVLFVNSAYEELASRTRFNVTPVLACLIIGTAVAGGYRWMVWLPLVFLVYIICAAQLSKFPFVYYTAIIIISFALLRSSNKINPFRARNMLYISILILISIVIMYSLYLIQYRAGLEDRIVATNDILTLLLYRPFFAVSDALYLWFAYFPNSHPFLGLANVGLLADIFNLTPFDPTTAIPKAFLGTDLTTMQTGFIGSGYAAFGFVGIAAHAFVAGLVIWFVSEIPFRLPNGILRTTCLAVLGLNTYFLTTRQLHTALLSGGLISTLLLIMAVFVLVRLNQKRLSRRVALLKGQAP